MKILWIDDDRLLVRSLIEDIRDEGHEVNQFYDAQDGLDEFESSGSTYDRIVVDIMMPARGAFLVDASGAGLRTGIVLVEKMVGLVPNIAAKIVVVSIVRDPDAKQRIEQLGVRYLYKTRTKSIDITGAAA